MNLCSLTRFRRVGWRKRQRCSPNRGQLRPHHGAGCCCVMQRRRRSTVSVCFQPLSGKRNTVRMRSFPELFCRPCRGIWRLPKGCAVWRRRIVGTSFPNFCRHLPSRAEAHCADTRRTGLRNGLSCCAARPRGHCRSWENSFLQTARHARRNCAAPIRCSVT